MECGIKLTVLHIVGSTIANNKIYVSIRVTSVINICSAYLIDCVVAVECKTFLLCAMRSSWPEVDVCGVVDVQELTIVA